MTPCACSRSSSALAGGASLAAAGASSLPLSQLLPCPPATSRGPPPRRPYRVQKRHDPHRSACDAERWKARPPRALTRCAACKMGNSTFVGACRRVPALVCRGGSCRRAGSWDRTSTTRGSGRRRHSSFQRCVRSRRASQKSGARTQNAFSTASREPERTPKKFDRRRASPLSRRLGHQRLPPNIYGQAHRQNRQIGRL